MLSVINIISYTYYHCVLRDTNNLFYVPVHQALCFSREKGFAERFFVAEVHTRLFSLPTPCSGT